MVLFVLTIDKAGGASNLRLEYRLKLLECKAYYDSREFREDLQRIFLILNDTVKASVDDVDNDAMNTVNLSAVCTKTYKTQRPFAGHECHEMCFLGRKTKA